jgi:chaperonin GroES
MSEKPLKAPYFTEGGKDYCLAPLGNRVLIKRDEEQETAGGIIIPDQAKETSLTGYVIKAGPDCEMVKEGERIFFARFTGKAIAEDMPTEVRATFEGVMICTEEDIIGHAVPMKKSKVKVAA